ncbi:discoidin domain-containing protein [Kutzneria sp. NPDC051319]|uniref:discoidin domain-containing protein n=1 Tax=Kutzneria sp. NPDC051319 TaxID=3155047 RepID=UPI00343B4EDF
MHHRFLGAALAVLMAAGAVAVSTSDAVAASSTTFYAAPGGQGSACTAATPCSLLTAQGKVRKASPSMSSDITVVLADGTYRLDKTFSFDAAAGDSATGGHTVTYQAAPGAHPVISGGQQVNGWKQGTGGIWSANVPAGTDTRQLYVDGVRANRASGPNPTGFSRTATGYTTSTTTIAGWHNPSDIEFVYEVSWTEVRCGVASVAGTTVTMKQPCFDNSTKKPYGVNIDQPSYVENAKELLDNPGEFYLDKPSHTLYYMPREGQDLRAADVEIPRLQTVVSGTGSVSNPLRGLSLKGITVQYGGWTESSGPDGFSEVQANMRLTGPSAWDRQGSCNRFSQTNPGTCPYGNWTMTPGNVVFDHTDGLSIQGDAFQHLGAAGLQLGQYVHNSSITGNVFTDISSNGIEIGNGADATPADLNVIPANNTIADNWVHHVAVEYTGGVGIFQGYTRYDTVTHNQVNDVPYSGISSAWGWGWNPGTRTEGNKITNNLIFDHLQTHIDGGGIYVVGQEGTTLANGLLISGNVVRNGAGFGHSIYTDGGSWHITETGNAEFGNDTNSFGGSKEANNPYGDFLFTDNYYEHTTPDFPAGDPTDLTLANNHQVSFDGTGVPASLLANAGLEAQYKSLTTAPAGTAPKNLAAGKPVQAQFLDGSTAQLQPESQLSYATDGNPATYVQASGQFKWQLVVDLQKSQSLGYVTVGMPQPHFATDFHVDASTDGTAWTTVGSVHGSGWGTVPVDFATPVTARYLRIVTEKPDDGGQRGDQMAISEVGAFAACAAGPDNAALNKPAQAYFIDGTQALMQPNSTPALGTDGNPDTWTQATQRYRWSYQVDLQKAQSVDVVALTMPADKFATRFHIDVSLDGSTFWTVARRVDAAGGVTGVGLDQPVKARYIKVVADRPDDGGQAGGQMAVSELALYGSN